jgi:hypothetical protein
MKKSLWEIIGHDKDYYTKEGQGQILELASALEILSMNISKEQLIAFREMLNSGHLYETLDILKYIIKDGTDYTL